MKKNQATSKALGRAHEANVARRLEISEHLKASEVVHEGLSKAIDKFADHLVDPMNHGPVPGPAESGLYSGLVEVEPIKCEFPLTVTPAGFGCVVVDPNSSNACFDKAIAASFKPTVPGVGVATPIPYTADTNVEAHYPLAKASAAGIGTKNIDGSLFVAMANACAIYIKPLSSVLDQNGMIYLLEVPEHPDVSATTRLNLGEILNHERTRPLSAVSLNPNEFVNCLNWHRQKGVVSSTVTPNLMGGVDGWHAPAGASSDLKASSLVIVVTGTAGTQYEILIRGSWLKKGQLTDPTVPQRCDPLGAACLYNTALRKRISGWTGPPSVVCKLFRAAMREEMRNLLGDASMEKAEARVVEKNGSKPSLINKLWTAAKHLAPMAKELVGLAPMLLA